MSRQDIPIPSVDHAGQVDAELQLRTPVKRGVTLGSKRYEAVIARPSENTEEGRVFDVTITMDGEEKTGQLIAPGDDGLLTILRLG